MKLKKGDYVNIEGVSKEVFDACVAVAVASGFSEGDIRTDLGEVNLKITNNGTVWAFSDGYSSCDDVAELTINEWLFSLAPDWAVDIKVMSCGEEYLYSDGVDVFIELSSLNVQRVCSNIFDFHTIATRSKPEKWVPKVGDVVIFDNQEVRVEHIKGNLAWVEKGNDSALVRFRHLKPKPSAEDEALKKLIVDAIAIEPNKNSIESITKALIKAGYKKC